MVADLLPEERRAEGFGILRVTFNVSATVAPAVAGILAARSYLLLFVTDAVISLVTAVFVAAMLPETRPALHMGGKRESVLSTFRGYFTVLRDSVFVMFSAICMLMTIVYMQINTTMGVYLRDVHGISTQGYGYLLSANAIMVVLLQFSLTRRVKKIPPFLAMALGTALFAIGFGAFGFATTYAMFVWAMVVITIGEMVVAPIEQALVARMAPEDMRGRYNAVFGFTWVIPGIVGPLLAGLVMDNLDPRWVWYAAGLIGLVAALGFVAMHRRVPQAALAPREAAV
jgi:MFS family permease